MERGGATGQATGQVVGERADRARLDAQIGEVAADPAAPAANIKKEEDVWSQLESALCGTGLKYEKHEVVTADKYKLSLVRLISPEETPEVRAKRTPVLF